MLLFKKMGDASSATLLIFQSTIKTRASVLFKLPNAGSWKWAACTYENTRRQTKVSLGKRSLFTFEWCQKIRNPSLFRSQQQLVSSGRRHAGKRRDWHRSFTNLSLLWMYLAKHMHVFT